MEPTLFLAWLSHQQDGGYFTAAQREERDHRDWLPCGPLHLSLHTTQEGAEAALLAAAEREWDADNLSYAHGPREAIGDLLDYMRRHVGYAAHVTEQPVQIDAEEPHSYPCPSCGGNGCASCAGLGEREEPSRLSGPLGELLGQDGI